MRDFGPKYMTEEFQSKVTLPESQGDGVKLAQDVVNAKYASDIAFPVVSYTADQLTRLASLTTDIIRSKTDVCSFLQTSAAPVLLYNCFIRCILQIESLLLQPSVKILISCCNGQMIFIQI